MGINVDDAPVVDMNTNPNNAADGARAFGDRAAAGRGPGRRRPCSATRTPGSPPPPSTSPGLGSTSVNTDFGVATSDQTKAEFDRNDLPRVPGRDRRGADEIMAAHIVAPALDPTGAPASLSKPMVTGILRNQLHYDGVVVTDALNAEALQRLHQRPAQRPRDPGR